MGISADKLHRMIEKWAWEALYQQARSAALSRSFDVFNCPDASESLESQTCAICRDNE